MKDPWFKLFGKTIPMKEEDEKDDEGFKNRISEDAAPADAAVVSDLSPASDDSKSSVVKADPNDRGEDPLPENLEGSQNCANGDNCKQQEGKTSNQEPPKKENGIAVPNPNTKQENVETETNAAENQDKAPKKPDKLLPCPRCDSMDTKFCYYNNYNVNQPRHFCKNCQRYWTAGGTMRNVPVGAGRRKNKNSTSHYRHMMMSDSMAGPRGDATDAAHHQVLPAAIASSARVLNGSNIQLLPLDVEAAAGAKVLNFGPDAPLCESMATALSLADHTVSGRKILRVKDEDKGSVTVENRDDQSCGSSSISNDKEGTASEQAGPGPGAGAGTGMPGIGWLGANGISSQAQQQQFYGACPWLYGWNFGWGACPSTAPAQMYLNGMAHAAAAAASAGIPWPFIPAATYWPAPAGWVGAAAGAWNMPPFSPAATTTSTSNSSSGGSGSPTLGKHSRDNAQFEDKPDGCLWVPKTLRIDDPGEAAKSSIWTTLGISAKSESITGGGIFKAFQSKTEDTDAMKTASQGLLAANPAALQRSMAFQEST